MRRFLEWLDKQEVPRRLAMPENRHTGMYIKHAVMLVIAAILYGLYIREPLTHVLSYFEPWIWPALFAGVLLSMWQSQALSKYAAVALRSPFSASIVQVLGYVGFVAFGLNAAVRAPWVLLLPLLLAAIVYVFWVTRNLDKTDPVELARKFRYEEELTRYKSTQDKPMQQTLALSSQYEAMESIGYALRDAVDYNDDTALAFAIDGAWGNGKTSVLNMVLMRDGRLIEDNYLEVRFEPWRYTTQESLVYGFYDEIGKVVDTLPGAKMARLDLAKFAQNYMQHLDKTGTLKSFFGAYQLRARNYAERIDKHLTRHNKRLLVIIDDVDRLPDDSHVMRTLQLAQYLRSDIPHSVVLFIADLERIEPAIPERLRNGYLHKFFDGIIRVPPPQHAELAHSIVSLGWLGAHPNENPVNPDFLGGNAEYANEYKLLLELIGNIRGAKRVVSMFFSYIGYTRKGIKYLDLHTQDLWFMTVLRFAHPKIYADIRKNPQLYTYRDMLDRTGNGELEAQRRQHFDALFKDMPNTEIVRLQRLLAIHFPCLARTFFPDEATDPDLTLLAKERRIALRQYLDEYVHAAA